MLLAVKDFAKSLKVVQGRLFEITRMSIDSMYVLASSLLSAQRPCVCRGRSTSVEQFTASSPLNLHIVY